ncbi:hypothetical protein COCC4DRAFT_151464 [Bipolaris maydis ATCC 48331]|uniref:Uncharacterized protein n=2 Tax=Cochliobolus heterostrophus TaxID=5016 RepID=M2V4Y1_COCH5|nr:uncharacterized protein COCC4DRAFT_151464 [Bipolaris maydis ATCC 48331]EMD95063.1 hypothetical protein COCHEDRAFT_1091638 [Bipolaris maydis C5]KAJ5061819.1 hypothetical protein J3E74DRAFT_211357 [Bipolaris maydis]ENI00079.1 hypothetical protein COCC4DRAFT_151464 [Bipolaris maydis ATCC 48331]KAJ6203423.1 hypothetical protein J3E72DRAFT_177801 [Bipolaris maydis]KAJ6214788.1 hypothetical protein PSV09DRAFT_1091638 [Bipolaris maydis]
MRSSLRISPAPFKSSFLSIPPSPFSPRTPLTPTVPLQRSVQKDSQQSSKTGTKSTENLPPTPLPWTWTCHQCHCSYRLNVTRRCLQDGHYYCSGTTTVKAWRQSAHVRRTKKHGACNSEFDYSGWKNWSRWRRDGPRNKAALVTDLPADTEDGDITTKKKDCWNTCDYPSECKWGKKFGIHTPVETGFPVVEADAKPALNSLADTTLKGNPTTENYEDAKTLRKSGTLNLWTALVASVERRKNGSVRLSSPLSVITQGETARKRAGKTALSPQENKGNMIIAVTELSVLGTTSDSTLFDSSDSSTAGDSFKPLLSRRRYRRTTSSPKTRANSDAKRVKVTYSTSKSDTHGILGDLGVLDSDFAPLTRVQSRYSGYQTCYV